MENVEIDFLKRPRLKAPILIEGLPGVGNVGKLAAEHLLEELKAQKFAEIYSKHFPPQVLVDDVGVARLVRNSLYYKKMKDSENDLVFFVGDYQALTPEGQYELTDRMLDFCQEYGVKRIYTLGGYGLGRMLEKPRVLGATTNKELVKEMKKHGVQFPRGEPSSGIVGASGLLLGMGVLRSFEGVCLMGETYGPISDPRGARAVLEILARILGLKVDFSDLEEKAQQIEHITSKLKELEMSISSGEGKADDLRYIG